MCDDEMSLEEYGKRYIELGGMDDGFAWALHPDLCNRSEIMERVIKQAHGMLYEYRGEIARLRAENERLRDVLGDAHGVICNQECQLRRLVDCEDIACEGVILDIRAILPNASHQTAGGK